MAAKPWWEVDVPRIIKETDDFYTRVEAVAPSKNKLTLTKKKIMEIRSWAPTLRMYDAHFESVLKQLGFFYVPNRVVPGPAFVFPIRDTEGKFSSAQTKPLEGSAYGTGSKYRNIGEKLFCPRWLGNDHATLKRIIELQKVIVVEGPFDLLAARLLCPDVPIMSPLTKLLGKNHIAYLRMLGVKDLVLMYDNEVSSREGEDGAGNMSMEQQAKFIKTMHVTSILAPAPDPSDCLKVPDYAVKLKAYIMAEV
jgi:hypothetical protein